MKKENELFEQLRQVPTELSKQDVAHMIKAFPGMPSQSFEQSNWTSLFNFKNISMTIISIVIAIGALNFSPFLNDTPVISEIDAPVEISTKIVTNKQESNEVSKIYIDEEATDNLEVNEEITAIKEVIVSDIVGATKVDKAAENEPNPVRSIVNKETQSASSKSAPTSELEKDRNRSNSKYDYKKPILELDPDFEKSPILSSFRMKRIKKKLYKNLIDDGIILSKSVAVEMELPGNKIFVNGVELSPKLFEKYKELTYKVKSGPNRKIKMSRHNIKIGDFNLDGFYGAGFGKFYNSMEDENVPKTKPTQITSEQLFDEEYKNLLDFAKSIRTPIDSKSPLFGVNLRGKNCKLLYDELSVQLIEDQFITAKNAFVVIQHQKEKLIINGETLAGDQKLTYHKIISRFKIKAGNKREILMSEHIISIGDYSRNEFTGTIRKINK